MQALSSIDGTKFLMNFTSFVSSVEINFAVIKIASSYQGSAFPWSCCSQVRNKPYGGRNAETTNQNESEQQILLVWDHVFFPYYDVFRFNFEIGVFHLLGNVD